MAQADHTGRLLSSHPSLLGVLNCTCPATLAALPSWDALLWTFHRLLFHVIQFSAQTPSPGRGLPQSPELRRSGLLDNSVPPHHTPGFLRVAMVPGITELCVCYLSPPTGEAGTLSPVLTSESWAPGESLNTSGIQKVIGD